MRARPDAVKPRGVVGVETPLIGRDHELARVRNAIEGVEAGRGGVLVVMGEAGIGKSYFLRLLLHSEAKDNFGSFSHAPYDELVERARAEADGRRRLELFHAADRMAVAEQVAAIPIYYFRNVALVTPHVHGWWECGKSWSSFADLVVDERR